ncbi:MAG: hypothetical protein R3F17_12380 [Planctomycetota bacterium]
MVRDRLVRRFGYDDLGADAVLREVAILARRQENSGDSRSRPPGMTRPAHRSDRPRHFRDIVRGSMSA